MSSLTDQIKQDVENNRVILFVKGEKGAPQCGFSAAVMNVFDELGVDYVTRDVLADPDLRQTLKEFSNWPTFPQVYINGKFVGGCDITLEMHKSGELQELLQTRN